ncbi:AcrR family transcriptional regulator [Kibdelosporangium banguiense]|uniref:AcrR family transcriptional regulator n=1 Tax=Kibdelosporangium banguiense TaxID=1365924 RepID=A0ABS4TYI3_9PSEU|nr:TetR/AcrR family transcriptional regulator [Kibdelosporangium banguiense]MBP2329462.1 AcrR family transcriptional regulator [Kibdelosporangium banguiense]
MAETGTITRRERLRLETTAEIKQVALQLMASGGPGAITLRAIARQMGMTPNAIYGYFATRDDLVTTLVNDVYTSLADAVEAAVASVPVTDPGRRIQAWGHAYRSWVFANIEGFRLVYGDAVPGYVPPAGGAAPEAELRFCKSLTELAAAAWPNAEHLYADSDFQWSDFDPALLDEVRPHLPGLPPAAVALALRIWGHLHGLVILEIHGHLRGGTKTMDKLFREELIQLVRSLGLPAPG